MSPEVPVQTTLLHFFKGLIFLAPQIFFWKKSQIIMAQEQTKSPQLQLNLNRYQVPIPFKSENIGTTKASKFIKILTDKDISSKEIRQKVKKGNFEITCDDGSVILITLLNKTESRRYILHISLISASFLEVAA